MNNTNSISSNLIVCWFNKNYKYTADDLDLLHFDDVYRYFSRSPLYFSLSGKEKCVYSNKSFFISLLKADPYLEQFLIQPMYNLPNHMHSWIPKD